MRIDYYSYESYTFSCKHCGWKGLGTDVDFGEQYPECFEVLCPKCKEWFDEVVSFPTFDEAIEKGPAIDKLAATVAKSYRGKWLDSLLKDISQLPDLDDDLMAFVVREINEGYERYIVVSYMGKDIWRELVSYEYYEQFINLGKKFKKKYGDKMIDFVPDVGDYYIYGDRFRSIDMVKNFRKEIKNQFDYNVSNLEKEINLLKAANNELRDMNIEMQKFFDKLAIPIIKGTVRNVEKQLRRFPIEANLFGDDSKLNFFEEVCVMLKEGSMDDYGPVEDTIESCCLDAYNELKDNESFIVHHQTNSDHQYLPEIIKDDFLHFASNYENRKIKDAYDRRNYLD